jgi:hypothetical protein
LILTPVILAEELHTHDGEDKDDNTQDERQVTESTHRSTHDGYEQVECWPRFSEFKHTQL